MAVQFRTFVVCVAALTAIRSTESYITCPKCTHAGNVIQCFQDAQTCAGAQVCAGTMSGLGVSVECGLRQNCALTVWKESNRCTSGLPFSLQDECHFCCSDLEDCRKQMALVQEGIDGATNVLHCPTCPPGTADPHDCLLNLQPCDPAVKVCSVEWSGGTVSGGCEKHSLLCRLHELQSLPFCGHDSVLHKSFCSRCCNSTQCLLEAFHANLTTPVSDVATSTMQEETTTYIETTTYTYTTTPRTSTPVPTCIVSRPLATVTPTPVTTTTTPPPTTTTTTTFVPTTTTTATSPTTITTTPTTTSPTTTTTTLPTTTTTTSPTTITTTPTTTTTTLPTTTTTTVATTTTTAPAPSTTYTTMTTVTTTRTAAAALTNREQCKDNKNVDCSVPGLCAVGVGRVYCPHTCGTCDTAEMIAPSVTSTCKDSVVGQVFNCQNLPDVCSQLYAHTLCPRTCGFCEDGEKFVDPIP